MIEARKKNEADITWHAVVEKYFKLFEEAILKR